MRLLKAVSTTISAELSCKTYCVDGFDLTVDEVELERNVKVARTRGRIDLLYRTLAWEVKRDLDRGSVAADLERELLLYLREIGERAPRDSH